MDNVGQKLKAYWHAQNLPISSGSTEEEIATFESRYQVRLPADMREYFYLVNGLDERYMDNDGFTFWSLSRLNPFLEECSVETGEGVDNPESYLVFADCYAWSWAYAIDTEQSSTGENRVIIIGVTKSPIRVAGSFTEFIELYLNQSPILSGEVPPS